MKPAARGRNDKADRWSPDAREVESNDAPGGDEAAGAVGRVGWNGCSTRGGHYREMVVDP